MKEEEEEAMVQELKCEVQAEIVEMTQCQTESNLCKLLSMRTNCWPSCPFLISNICSRERTASSGWARGHSTEGGDADR